MSNQFMTFLFVTIAISFFTFGVYYERVRWNRMIYFKGKLPRPMFLQKLKRKKKVK